MICPRCEASGQTPNAYCKRCGAWLPDPLTAPGSAMQRLPPDARLKSIMQFSLICALLAAFIAISLVLTLDEGTAPWSVFLAIVFSVFIVINQLVAFFVCRGVRNRLKPEVAERPEAIERGSAPEALEEAKADHLKKGLSVTEGTTERLEPVPREGGRRGA